MTVVFLLYKYRSRREGETVAPLTAPEVHYTRTILFAAGISPARSAVKNIFCNYIFTDSFLGDLAS